MQKRKFYAAAYKINVYKTFCLLSIPFLTYRKFEFIKYLLNRLCFLQIGCHCSCLRSSLFWYEPLTAKRQLEKFIGGRDCFFSSLGPSLTNVLKRRISVADTKIELSHDRHDPHSWYCYGNRLGCWGVNLVQTPCQREVPAAVQTTKQRFDKPCHWQQ